MIYHNKYRIEPNRWQNWDYSAQGGYFITMCISDREAILGKIIDGKMYLSEYGEIVRNEFIQMGTYNKRATVDEWVIMPNHVHCIIILGAIDDGDVEKIHDGDVEKIHDGDVEKIHEFSLQPPAPFLPISSSQHPTDIDIKQYRRIRRKMLIPLLEGKFKTLTSKQINLLRKTPGRETWQHDYYDHVIRNDHEHDRIQQYIIYNPAKWQDDTFNSENGSKCNDDGEGLWY